MHLFDPLYNDIPKVELHCHLEGSIRTRTILDIALKHHLHLPSTNFEDLDQIVKIRKPHKNLQAVLDAFEIFQNSIADYDAVERITYELCEDASRQNIKLLEIRFSPDWAFSGHRLDWDLALAAIHRAQDRAWQVLGLHTGLIAITSRSLGIRSCEETVDWAIQHMDQILGIDLADNENDHPISEFLKPVLRAKKAGLKLTVHTGEDTPASAVMDTIKHVHPDRIGHGIHIIDDPRVIDVVIKEGITLEINPWSNYLTNSVPTIEGHPLKQLFDLGVHVTINSDDPQVLDTNLNHEYYLAHQVLGLTFADILTCNQFALQASFLPEEEKKFISRQVPAWQSG